MSKNRSLLFLIPFLVTGMFAFNSCEKEVVSINATQPVEIPEKVFFANVDGAEFVDTVLWAAENSANGTITITASVDGDYPKMILVLPSDISSGTYNLGGLQSTHQAILKFGILPTEQFEALTGFGTLSISTHNMENDYLRGTFTFTAVASPGNTSTIEFDVSDGDFTVSY